MAWTAGVAYTQGGDSMPPPLQILGLSGRSDPRCRGWIWRWRSPLVALQRSRCGRSSWRYARRPARLEQRHGRGRNASAEAWRPHGAGSLPGDASGCQQNRSECLQRYGAGAAKGGDRQVENSGLDADVSEPASTTRSILPSRSSRTCAARLTGTRKFRARCRAIARRQRVTDERGCGSRRSRASAAGRTRVRGRTRVSRPGQRAPRKAARPARRDERDDLRELRDVDDQRSFGRPWRGTASERHRDRGRGRQVRTPFQWGRRRGRRDAGNPPRARCQKGEAGRDRPG